MGNTSGVLNKKSSAREVVEHFSEGNPDVFLSGRVAVVTGGASGIGTETVKALTSAGCRVLIGCRSVAAGNEAVRDRVFAAGDSKYDVPSALELVSVHQLDLEDLESVRKFASIVQAESRLDFLVLNAGIMAVPALSKTANGWERQVATNHFGHFYLTKLLLGKMTAQSTPSRIVVVSSEAHRMMSGVIERLNVPFASSILAR
jgi:NAD(P)-dependent dehydrogenase (short-subunit alcohol dehydrogenase family)